MQNYIGNLLYSRFSMSSFSLYFNENATEKRKKNIDEVNVLLCSSLNMVNRMSWSRQNIVEGKKDKVRNTHKYLQENFENSLLIEFK